MESFMQVLFCVWCAWVFLGVSRLKDRWDSYDQKVRGLSATSYLGTAALWGPFVDRKLGPESWEG